MIYVIKYCKVDDAREVLKLDMCYNNYSDAVHASIELEADPDIYTAWVEREVEDIDI